MRKLIAQFAKFGVVGGLGVLVNLAVFNLLLFTVFDAKRIHEGPLLANIVATIVAIVFNWAGNRYWAFREHRGKQVVREGVEFGVVSLGGLLIGLGCLWVSHYLLGFDSKLADNIASNVVGLALGTVFRFALYRLWVFRPRRDERGPAVFPDAEADVETPLPVAVVAPVPGETRPAA
jgi:putative flippase GtrA